MADLKSVGGEIRVKSLKDEDGSGFDPYLGLAVASTWWVLGRWSNRLQSAKNPSERRKVLMDWISEIRAGSEDHAPAIKSGAVNEADLGSFADTVLRLLKAKYDGKAIAGEVRRLVRPSRIEVADRGRFLVIDEPRETFWSIEYMSLFEELDCEEFPEPGWLNAVGICENRRCMRFFIKQRIDNRFHSDACRTNTANREAYKRRRHGRAR